MPRYKIVRMVIPGWNMTPQSTVALLTRRNGCAIARTDRLKVLDFEMRLLKRSSDQCAMVKTIMRPTMAAPKYQAVSWFLTCHSENSANLATSLASSFGSDPALAAL